MTYCRDCGETLPLEAGRCPACGRPIGMSTIGPALERQAGPGRRRLVLIAAAAVVGVVVIGLVVSNLGPSGPSRAEFERAAVAASASLVHVSAEGAREESGIVLRRAGDALVVATDTGAAPDHTLLHFSAGDRSVSGVTLFHGRAPQVASLAVAIVPEGSTLERTEVHVVAHPEPGSAICAISPGGQPLAIGHVGSVDESTGAIVHDAALTGADRGAGLIDAQGRLVALATRPAEARAGADLLASALLERLLVHEVALTEDWSEHALPLPAGTLVGIAVRGAMGTVEARVGARGRIVRSGPAVGGTSVVEFAVDAPGPLQLHAPGAKAAVVVTLAPL